MFNIGLIQSIIDGYSRPVVDYSTWSITRL